MWTVLASVLLAGSARAADRDLALIAAAKRGDAATVRTLVKQGIPVDAAEGDGSTALLWASYRDDGDAAGALLGAGANPNAANDLGATAIWAASLNGSLGMVQRLLDAGANPNLALAAGETPLMVASRAGSAAIVRALLDRGADVNAKGARGQTALMWAVAQKHAGAAGVLLAHGADVNARSSVWSQVMAVPPHGMPDYNRSIPHGGDTPLMFAARVGDLASARLLVAAGANVNDADAWTISAATLAAHSGFADLLEFLLERGADPDAAGPGFTALHEAIMRRDTRMAAALLARGANPNAPLQTWTPTRRSSRDWNFDPSLVGASPFWLAARFSDPAMMRLLLKHGADPRFVHHASSLRR